MESVKREEEKSMNKTEQILEFDKVKELWKEYALTEAAKKKIEETVPYMEEMLLRAKLRETTEARILLEKNGIPPLASLSQMKEWIDIAAKGDCLTAEQLEGVERGLTAVSRLKKYLNLGKVYDISLAYYEESLYVSEELREAIRMQIRNGRVEDNASKLLKSYRMDLSKEELHMREKADAAMRKYKSYLSDHFSTMRNGHLCIPIKKEYKNKISGIVIDQSSTGSTVFVEPNTVTKHYDAIQLLLMCEENEVRRILYELTALVYEHAEALEQNMRIVEKLDFIFSKGKLSLSYDGSEPKIQTERCIQIKDGRHPLMDKSIAVPLQFEIGNGIDGVVITGPNTGGKTVALKTVALNSYMAQCGLHVACKEMNVCMNSHFLCDIGDGQNLSENLSTFSAHIVNVLDILKKVNPDSLVIMDELGSGTDPTEGMGIAIAILEELQKSGALFLVTTHYPEVKTYAEEKERMVNARMTFDKESLKPLYQLVIGEAGESCAFYIAGKLGKTASKAAYGEEKLPEQLRKMTDSMQGNSHFKKEKTTHIRRQKRRNKLVKSYKIGDSVMVYPDKKIGIVCEPENEKGVLRVQMPNKKIWVNHKRVKLHVAAEKLYPEDYDFSILFDTVENRKLRHQMERGKMIEDKIVVETCSDFHYNR